MSTELGVAAAATAALAGGGLDQMVLKVGGSDDIYLNVLK